MGKAVPAQHPAVVLRSQFQLLRALLAIAMVAVVGLSIAVVIVANDDEQISTSGAGSSVQSLRYGGFNPATGRPEAAPLPQREHPFQSRPGTTRYDGGPEEGTRAIVPVAPAAPLTSRYDGGPEEGTRGIVPSHAPSTSSSGDDSLRGPGARTD
jgi:hypothetical protein